MPQSLGERNKNYLNVKNGAVPWMDKDGKDSGTDERGHAIFKDPAYGVRAGILTLRSYFFRHQLRTIAQILARWEFLGSGSMRAEHQQLTMIPVHFA